jgi:beta-phosphoglucomutase
MITKTDLENLKAVLFDMDGVLVDSMNHHLHSWKELLEYFNITVSDEFIFEHEGAMSSEVIRDLFGNNGFSIEEKHILEIYSSQNLKFQEKYLGKVGLYPQAIPLLELLKERGLALGLVTSSRMNLVEKIWNKNELSLFSTIVTADDVKNYKPHPDPYLKALNRIGHEARECLVVENAPAGIRSANAAGIPCFAIASTLPEEKLSRAQKIFTSLASLSLFLEEQLSRGI